MNQVHSVHLLILTHEKRSTVENLIGAEFVNRFTRNLYNPKFLTGNPTDPILTPLNPFFTPSLIFILILSFHLLLGRRKVCRRGNVLDFNSKAARFESWPENLISSLRFSNVFLNLSGKCLNYVVWNKVQFLRNPFKFIRHQAYYHRHYVV